MIEQLKLILQALPWTGPAVLGGFVLGLLTTLLFPKRRSRTDRLGFALLTWCLVIAAVVTLSPVKNDYFGVPTSGCDWTVWKPLARQYWFSSGSRPPNVWLFFPAGVGVMLLDGTWRKLLGIAFLVALPPGIETLQDLYPELKRSCSSQDVADNWTGLAMGLALGLVLALIVGILRMMTRAARRRRDRRNGVLNAQPYGGRDGFDDEPRVDDGSRLPLGGRADNRRYDDFADFDDMPNSSRWYEQDDEVRANERTRQHPSRLEGSGADSFDDRSYGADFSGHGSATRDVRGVGGQGTDSYATDSYDDGGATRAMSQDPRNDGRFDHTPPYGTPIPPRRGGSTWNEGGSGDDDTQIIHRS